MKNDNQERATVQRRTLPDGDREMIPGPLPRPQPSPTPPGPAPETAQQAISGFEQSSAPGVWPYIQKDALIADIRAKVASAFSVKQGTTPLCGPAAVVFELVARNPKRYVDICRSLYETGSFQARTMQVRPSNTLVRSRLRSGISVADWMLLATLRDTENAIFPVDSTSGNFVMGVTTPSEMKGWVSELLGLGLVEYESTYFYGEFEAMRQAAEVRSAGGVAFLMVNSALVGNPSPIVGYPDHWVSYLGGLRIDDGVWYQWDSGHIWFDCYSWGSTRHVDAGEGPFEDYMWGVVTGR